MAIDPPVLDPRDEDELVADVIDDLPSELSDRSRSNPLVKVVEAMGAFYGQILYRLNLWPEALEAKVFELLGLRPEPATQATVDVTFTAAAGNVAALVPVGTLVKAGSDQDAPQFETLSEIIVLAGQSRAVKAQSVETGVAQNVAPGELTELETPVPGIVSVINFESAHGGQDEESLVQLRARAALAVRSQGRIVTEEDVEQATARVEGIARAKALGSTYTLGSGLDTAAGVTAVGVLEDGSVNRGVLFANTRDAILEVLKDGSIPGMAYTPFFVPIRLVMIERVVVVLERGAVLGDVKLRIEEALRLYLTAYDIVADNGRELLGTGWEWGAPVYRNEIISLIDRVEGVKRVKSVAYRISDDYGTTWDPPAPLDPEPLEFDIEAGSASLPPGIVDEFALVHWGAVFTPVAQLDVIEATS